MGPTWECLSADPTTRSCPALHVKVSAVQAHADERRGQDHVKRPRLAPAHSSQLPLCIPANPHACSMVHPTNAPAHPPTRHSLHLHPRDPMSLPRPRPLPLRPAWRCCGPSISPGHDHADRQLRLLQPPHPLPLHPSPRRHVLGAVSAGADRGERERESATWLWRRRRHATARPREEEHVAGAEGYGCRANERRVAGDARRWERDLHA
mmetsp:Transcript_50159/g.118845  ORF Transcript_50159/g.118845 Transcript_50159/m.118845 type:complete len:208 (+) Transcript_50159:321-944(+)